MSLPTSHKLPDLDSLGKSASFMKWVRIFAGISVFIAAVVSWLFLSTLFIRLRIQFKRDQYRVESFEVADAVNPHSRKGFSPYWLTGTVAGRTERVRPELPPTFKPRRTQDLLSAFPRGSTLPVLYDPDAPEIMIQGETLRVFHFTPNFWRRENRRCIKFLGLVLLPLPLTLGFYRYVSKRAYIFPRFKWLRTS